MADRELVEAVRAGDRAGYEQLARAIAPRLFRVAYRIVQDRDAAGDPWTLDLWFLAAGTTQFDLEHMKTLPQRLTPDVRAAILRIKEDRQARAAPAPGPSMPSYEIYEAVLDRGVRTPAEFERYLAERRLDGD